MLDEKYSKLSLTKIFLVIAGILLAVLYWFIETFIHYVASGYEHDFFTNLIHMDSNELVMRLTFTSVLVVTSMIIQGLVNRIRKSGKITKKAFQELDLYKNLLIHDFRNILQNIQLSAEILLHDLTNYEISENHLDSLHLIEEQSIRGKLLISNVLISATFKENGENQFINIMEVLNDSIEFVTKSFPKRNVNIHTNFSDVRILVQANKFLLDVFENILFNAIKHNTNENVEIRVDISKVIINDIKYVKFEFKDNGIGISDERKKIIFQKDQKISIESSGLGFGLSLVKKIITQYNGKIWIEDKIKGDYSKGSNFKVIIPTSLA